MIFKKRFQWAFRDDAGKINKFNTEAEALAACQGELPVEEVVEETLDAEEEEEASRNE